MARFDPTPDAIYHLDLHGRTVELQMLEHPNAPGIVYAMEGGQAMVFRCVSQAKTYALKTMKPKYRSAALPERCAALGGFSRIPGMSACNRYCLTPQSSPVIVGQYPQLEYSLLMPWMDGISWFDIVAARTKKPLPSSICIALAQKFAEVVGGLEARSLAHCDLSAANVIVTLGAEPTVELIDLEDIYSPTLSRPRLVPAGTPGYQHLTSQYGQWGPHGDRFAAAVLLGEILGWTNEDVARRAYGETYFDPHELQQTGSLRFHTLIASIDEIAPRAATLFERAWATQSLEQCPSIAEWHSALTTPRSSVVAEWGSPIIPSGSGLPIEWTHVPVQQTNHSAAPTYIWETFGTPVRKGGGGAR